MSQAPDTQPGPYYVSVIRGNNDHTLVSGPYPLHQDALDRVNKSRIVSERHDPRAAWYAFGTVRMREAFDGPGVLQRWGYNLDLEKEAA